MQVFNPGRTPQIVDEAVHDDDGNVIAGGHILGGGEWGDYELNPVLQAALDDGRLLTPPGGSGPQTPPIVTPAEPDGTGD